jgi:RNA polymerase sigma factor (sigma-70 family)
MDAAVQAVDPGADLASDVTLAARGDRSAFERLIRATQATVTAITLAIVGASPEAEEIAQDVYLAAWRGLATLRNPDSFLPWLRQLARNQSNEALRCRARTRRIFHEGEAQELLERAVDPGGSPAQALAHRQTAEAVAAAIDALPDDTREVVVLYYREGRSVEQVARLLGLREDLVRKRMSRARAALRGTLFDRAGDVLAGTSPGSDFSASVLAAIPAAGTAAGAGTAAKAAASVAGGTLLAKVIAVLGGVGVGSVLGGVPLWFGVGKMIDRSPDERERIALRRFRRLRLVALVVFLLLWSTAAVVHPPAIVFWAVYLLSFARSVFFHIFVKPRSLRRRWTAVSTLAGYALGAVLIWHALPQLTRH